MKLSIRKLIAGLALVTLMLSAMLAAVCIMVLYSLKFPPIVAARPFWLPTMTMIFCVLIGFLLSIPAMRIISSPLKKLSEAQKEITGGNFDVRLDESDAPGEMKLLFRSFNQMASELSETEIFRNDFINNFSHEFKTPIVSIRGFAHQLLYDDSLTDEQKQEYLTIIANESDRLTTMSANVLLLSGCSASQPKEQETPLEQETAKVQESLKDEEPAKDQEPTKAQESAKEEEPAKEHEPLTMITANFVYKDLLDGFAEYAPEVNIDLISYSGSNMTAYTRNSLKAGQIPDIYATSYLQDANVMKDNLIDLSKYGFVNNYITPTKEVIAFP